MIYTITGKAGQGKTITLLDKLLENKSKYNIIITNPQTIGFYESFLAKNHIRGKILTITDVARYIWSEHGIVYPNSVTTIQKYAILSQIIKSSKNLSIVKSTSYTSGIINKISNAISDMKKELISSEQLNEMIKINCFSDNFGKKLYDLSYIMPAMEKRVKELDLIFEEDIPVDFYGNGITNKEIDNIFIDTLSEYNTYSIKVISYLCDITKDIYIAFRLTSQKDNDYFAFSDNLRAYNAVLEYASARNYQVTKLKASRKTSLLEISNLKRGIDILAETFFEHNSTETSSDDSVVLFEASSTLNEVNFVSSEIKKLVHNGVNYDDIIVSAPVAEEYLPYIQQSFTEHNIPVHYFKTDVLVDTRLYEIISFLLNSVIKEVTLDDIMKVIQLEFLDFKESDSALIDSFVSRFGPDINIALENCKVYDPEEYENIKAIIDTIAGVLADFRLSISEGKSVSDYISSIMNLLIAYDVQGALNNDIQNLYNGNEYQMCNDILNIWNSMMGVFDAMYDVYKNQALTIDEFTAVFEKLCNECKLVNNEKYYGETRFLSLPDTTNGRSKYLFVLGCNEGSLISVPEEAFFADEEKEAINNAMPCNLFCRNHYIGKKVAEVYSSFTSPYNKLYISWPLLSSQYADRTRAGILDNICHVFAGNLIKNDDYIKAIGESDFTDMLCAITEHIASNTEFPPVIKDKINKYAEHPMFRDRLKLAINNMLSKKNHFDVNYHLNNTLELSVTKAEKYNECPFKYFVSTVLTPKEKKLFQETSANRGIFYHSVFNKFYTGINANGISCKDLAKNRPLFETIIDKIIDEVKKDHNENIFYSSSKYHFLSNIMAQTSKMSVWYSVLQLSRGDYNPTMMEHEIDSSKCGYELSNGQKVFMSGIIDRVDLAKVDDTTYARIIDYKSGNVSFDNEKMSAGIQLQLPLYLKSLSEYEHGGMYYFHVYKPVLDSESGDESILSEYKLSGPTLNSPKAITAADNSIDDNGSSSSAVVRISTTASGEYSKRSDLISKEEMKECIEYAEKMFLRAAEGIISGNSVATPVRLKNFSACDYCSYKALCSN